MLLPPIEEDYEGIADYHVTIVSERHQHIEEAIDDIVGDVTRETITQS